MTENYDLMADIVLQDIVVLKEKGKTYKSSWRQRGGVGAFMMLARKFDRIENICSKLGWDVFIACEENVGDILDDIRDLRRYLLLVEAHVLNDSEISDAVKCGADRNYVDQDRLTPEIKI